jgi:AAA domain
MLLWINGPFGGGKTATAFELRRRLPGSVVCDPELVGFGMHRMLPHALRTDYQDLPPWRESVRYLLSHTLRSYPGPVIVPMTLINPAYFDEIIGGLRRDGADVRHFSLLAERGTILRRTTERAWVLGLSHDRWAVDHLDQCLARLRQPEFAEHVPTDGCRVAQVADAIAASAGLTIAPSSDGPVRAWLRRRATSIRHIRFD